ncbi:Auxin Efflux Carrier [Magnetococcus marinus MC-1]|uniref:Auxin Efflux Carrier n=1 Tax=Magnetococcus marinus (strain ATCC BAA-1437 / JCM 17883 / MC-1) TaxID=156889 RepID=A0L555_MAGMM|nr:AEC family transporter [Magnetococcus marinus]ABK43098.1 Auxin Efflux Carrier [Magnetococcus marinus MC-1]
MENLILVFLLVVAGYGFQRLPAFPAPQAAAILNQYVIHVSLPALVLWKVPTLPISSDLLAPILMPWLMLLASAALVLLVAKLLHWQRPLVGGMLMVVPLGNTSFVGVPMIEALYGSHGLPYAILYDQTGSFLALATYGSIILASYHGQGMPGFHPLIRKVVTFPPFLALVAALILRFTHNPPFLEFYLQRLAETLVPVVMVAVGLSFKLRPPPGESLALAVGLTLKLLVTPLLALALCLLLGWQGVAAQVSVLEAGMPSMITAGALAMAAGFAPQVMAAMVGWGILLAFASLLLIKQLLYLLV